MEQKNIFKKIAELIISELDFFSQNFQMHESTDANVLAYPEDGFNEAPSVLQEVRKVGATLSQARLQLQKEPFIAYVKVEVNGNVQIVYICRNYTPDFSPKGESSWFVSYKAPWGRVAEMDLDSMFNVDTHAGNLAVRVLERNLFRPMREAQQWDGKNNQLALASGIFSIESLRSFLQEYIRIEGRERAQAITVEVAQLETNLRQALEKELAVKEGLAREIRSKMSLRDQPTLDQIQGDIFRLPLSLQLIITGAPGTGKTTTLIKRIAQKSNPSLLDASEKNGLTDDQLSDYFGEDKWLMFTPTELLKNYLKEAFNLEGVPASDRRIKTWDEERIRISRDVLDFSKVGDKGLFIPSNRQILKAANNLDLIEASRAFDNFFLSQILERFNQAVKILKSNATTPRLAFEFERVNQALQESESLDLLLRTILLLERLFELREIFIELDKEIDAEVENHLIKLAQTRESLFQEVFSATQVYEKEKAEAQIEPEEDEALEEPSTDEPKTSDFRLLAHRQLRKTILWYSQRIAKGQSIPKDTLHSRIVQIILKELPSLETITVLGKKAIDRKTTDTLTRGYNNLLVRIPVLYQSFRRAMLRQNEKFFLNSDENAILDRRIDENEYDLIISTILRNAQIILSRHRRWLTNNSNIPLLEKVKTQYVTQVSVDEATDFSSLKLAAMFHLSHPFFKSFTLSGDLMQRLTPFGLNNWDECQFMCPSFQLKPVSTVYRQSQKLLCVAVKLYKHFINEEPPFKSAFAQSAADPDPLRFKSKTNTDSIAWITQRIIDIYNINQALPSIAIFVPEESHITEIYKTLSPLLKENSIDLEACYGGKILSTEGKVRIFSVQYIKGLEFEGVFFLNLDQLPSHLAELVEKYLYVGLTRAASFLAVIYTQEFPEKIRFVESDFIEGDWRHLVK